MPTQLRQLPGMPSLDPTGVRPIRMIGDATILGGDMAPSEHVDILRTVPLFAHVPTRTLRKVAQMTTDVTHEAGHDVVKQGAGAHFLHIIVTGNATVSADDNHIADLGPGDYFGEIALLDGGKRTATVTATTDLRVLGINATSFRRLVQADVRVAESLPDIITDRLRELDERLRH
ncbi:MAG: cyclic nucleotide-binding domain-containing protein [Acidimicrobiia bacterium]